MQTVLIATSNPGKFAEITAEFDDLSFRFVSLKTLKLDSFEPEEPHATTWENALEKARFYARRSGLLTIAEDTGLFVDALHGKPGVQAKRFGKTEEERNVKLLQTLKGVPQHKRTAYFETSACVYDPSNDSFSIFKGAVQGLIARSVNGQARKGMGYDAVFYYSPLKKIFAELSLLEKNRISHRGKAVNQVKYFLMHHYDFKQIVVQGSVIVKDRKLLMTKRRDLRPEFNDKWEFPGGAVEPGESFRQCLIRETKEETGFTVRVIEQLPEVPTITVSDHHYQVHLVFYICTIQSGKLTMADAESSECGWFTYNQVLNMDLLPLNKKCIQLKHNAEVIKKYVD